MNPTPSLSATVLPNSFSSLSENEAPDPVILDALLQKASEDFPRMRGNVKRLTSHLVLKSTPLYRSRVEAEAMRFVAQHCPSIPECGDEGHLVLDYIEGEPFQRASNRLSPTQHEAVMKQLAAYVADLRRIPQLHPPSPDLKFNSTAALPQRNWIDSPLGHAMTDFSMTQVDEPFGPFAAQRDFNDWKVSRYAKFGDAHPPTAQRIAEIRRAMPDDHAVVFTHGDINRKNVLVRVKGGGDGPGDVEVVALLDWEQAGWRPAFWESFKWRWEGATSEEWNNFALEHLSSGYEADVVREEELQGISGYFTP